MLKTHLNIWITKTESKLPAALNQSINYISEDEVLLALDKSEHRWKKQFLSIGKLWRRN